MDNVEIYDSSNSHLSSDEYSRDADDDDGLMDVAISKQQKSPDPQKARESHDSQTAKPSSTTSTSATSTPDTTPDTTPEKSSSTTTTTSRKTSTDLDPSVVKAPEVREHIQQQIKQMQRNNKAHLYFKRRSIKWLNQPLCNKVDYQIQLKRVIQKYKNMAAITEDFRKAREVLEAARAIAVGASPMRPLERTPSHSSRSYSRSDGSTSPELICLDDTENEDSPEKLEPVKSVKQPPLCAMQAMPEATEIVASAENGNGNDVVCHNEDSAETELNEFITIKPTASQEPVIEEAAVINNLPVEEQQQQQQPNQLDLSTLSSGFKITEAIVESALEPVPTPTPLPAVAEPATLKRRRSNSPTMLPPPVDEKRAKSVVLDDDDDIEVIASAPAQATIPRSYTPAVPAAHALTLQNAFIKTATANGMQLKQLVKEEEEQQQQQQQEPLANLDTGMNLVYDLGPPMVKRSYGIENAGAEKIMSNFNKTKPPTPMSAPPSDMQKPVAAASAGRPLMQFPVQQQQRLQLEASMMQAQSAPATPMHLSSPMPLQSTPMHLWADRDTRVSSAPPMVAQPRSLQQEVLPVPMQLEHQEVQLPPFPAPIPQQQQVQPAEPPQTPLPSQAPANAANTTTEPPPQVNNSNVSNPDAAFHLKVKDIFNDLNQVMTERLSSVPPEIMSIQEEMKTIDRDIANLSNLIKNKEDEYNRLIHMRLIKEELRSRLQSKERALIVKEILSPLLTKNCSSMELYEMFSLLLQEQNATMPSQDSSKSSAMDYFLNRMENNQGDLNMLRIVMGVTTKPEPDSRRNSMMPQSMLRESMVNHQKRQTQNKQSLDSRAKEVLNSFRDILPQMNQSNHLEAVNKPRLSNNNTFKKKSFLDMLTAANTSGVNRGQNTSSQSGMPNGGGAVGGFFPNCNKCHRQNACYVCMTCQDCWYCSEECQTRDWPSHAERCRSK